MRDHRQVAAGAAGRLRRDPLWRALRALRPDPAGAALAVLAGTAALGAAIALMGTSGWLISRAAQQPPVLYLMVAVVSVRALGIGRGVLRYAERLASHDVVLRGVVTLRETLYQRLSAADPAVAAGLRRGDLLARVGADVDTLSDVVVRALFPFAVALVTAGATVLALALILPAAAAVLAVALLLAGVVAPILAGLAARRAERDAAAARTAVSAEVLTLLDGLPELTVAGVVPDRRSHLARLERGLARDLDAAARPAAWAAGLASLATGAAVVGCLLLGVTATASGALAPVMLAVVTLIPLAAAETVIALPGAATTLVRARAAATRVTELLDAPPAARRPDARNRISSPGLEVRGLACGWAQRPPAVRGVDLDLPFGARVAVVGASGTGKSTLLLTLAGLLPPRSGAVTLVGDDDGAEVSLDGTAATAALRHAVLFTADDAHVFTTTVRENLRLARHYLGDDDLHAALETVGLGAWLAGLPDGLDTMIGTGAGPGGRLSGGERRRLLLARATLSDAGVLLLDEPAEHLDTDTADDFVGAALGAAMFGDRTVVVVTHRLSALDAADEVIVLAGGGVVARGTHEQLLRDHEPYRAAWLAEREPARSPGQSPARHPSHATDRAQAAIL